MRTDTAVQLHRRFGVWDAMTSENDLGVARKNGEHANSTDGESQGVGNRTGRAGYRNVKFTLSDTLQTSDGMILPR